MPEQPSRAPVVTDAIPPRLRRNGGSPRQVLALCVIGTLVLGLFASRDLPSWIERVADTPSAEPLRRAATAWDAAMAKIGFVRPHEALRETIARLQELGWGTDR